MVLRHAVRHVRVAATREGEVALAEVAVLLEFRVRAFADQFVELGRGVHFSLD